MLCAQDAFVFAGIFALAMEYMNTPMIAMVEPIALRFVICVPKATTLSRIKITR